MITVGLIFTGVAIKFLVTGKAGRRIHFFTPEHNPFGYWFIVAFMLAVAVFALVAGWHLLRRNIR